MPTMCISGHVFAKAGWGINKLSGANLIVSGSQVAVDAWIEEAESYICNFTRHDWTAVFDSLSTARRSILQGICSDQAAIYCLNADMTGNGNFSRIEAEDRVNILRDSILRGLSILRDMKNQDFTRAA